MIVKPEPDLPAFAVMARRRVAMTANPGPRWEIEPFIQRTLRIAERAVSAAQAG